MGSNQRWEKNPLQTQKRPGSSSLTEIRGLLCSCESFCFSLHNQQVQNSAGGRGGWMFRGGRAALSHCDSGYYPIPSPSIDQGLISVISGHAGEGSARPACMPRGTYHVRLRNQSASLWSIIQRAIQMSAAVDLRVNAQKSCNCRYWFSSMYGCDTVVLWMCLLWCVSVHTRACVRACACLSSHLCLCSPRILYALWFIEVASAMQKPAGLMQQSSPRLNRLSHSPQCVLHSLYPPPIGSTVRLH